VNRHFCVFFAHRREPEYFSSLLLTLPVLDDNGNEEQAIYHKVWWGISDPSLPFHEIPATVLLLASTYVVSFFCLRSFHRNRMFSTFFGTTASPTMNLLCISLLMLLPSSSARSEINPAGLRTVLVSGLPLLHDLQALQVLEGALISLFEEYCPEAVNVGKYSM
jgi:hypothetical protein